MTWLHKQGIYNMQSMLNSNSALHVYDDCVPSPYILFANNFQLFLETYFLVGHVLYNAAVDNGVSYLW